MIVNMKFINISGPMHDIDRVTEHYLSKYEIQLESALQELKTEDNLRPFVEANPYRDALERAARFVSHLKEPKAFTSCEIQDPEEIFNLIKRVDSEYQEIEAQSMTLRDKTDSLREKQRLIAPFRPLDCEIGTILNYKFIAYRFGRIATEFYNKIETYVYHDLNAIFIECERDDRYVYGVYFVSPGEANKVDAIFRSLHFEYITLPSEFQKTPREEYRKLKKEIDSLQSQIDSYEDKIDKLLTGSGPQILAAKARLEELSDNFDVRKMAACVENKKEDYYILCGWIPEEQLGRFLEETKNDEDIFIVVDDDKNTFFGEPPTKLKNPKLFKPFEMYVGMYGLPAHNEIDPTIFVAVTYSFIFGVMFGDVGQGLLLLIGGALLYHFKKMPLAGIVSSAGFFSTIFGLMFGSVFGFENVLKPLWLRPIDNMTTLPFVGKLNTVFIVSIAFGMGLILVAMILHIVNAVQSKDTENIWFAANGVAGLVFYASTAAVISLFMTGHKTPAGIVLAVMFGLPLLFMLLKEPITRKIEKRAASMEEGPVMFLIQGIFELFETLLSYFSNTLSFVRIGAFAVSHAAIMEVVLILSGAESGNPNWLGVVFGNLFVCGFEGLIVGIQVLRLEYYEMFSRFYKGSGRAFTPYRPHNKQTSK